VEDVTVSYETPYAGLKVLDLSQGVAGPYAAMLLAQYGADVVKVEPYEGDWSRMLGVRYGDHTAFSIGSNLGKRAIAVDLKTTEGREIVNRLARNADVFLESFRPGVAARLGVGYEAIAALSPRVIYVSISGFGQTGPESARPAMDPILQAFTGLIATNRGPDGIPHRVQPILMDMSTALCTFQALATTLHARGSEARGRYLDVSLIQAGAAVQFVHMTAHYLERGNVRPGLSPGGNWKTADGWMYASILHDSDFGKLCDALEVPHLKDEARYATSDLRHQHAATLTPALQAAFAARTMAELGRRLKAAGIMHARVNTYSEFLEEPHVEASGIVTWIDQPGVGRVPFPRVPGLKPPATGTRLGTSPAIDQHRKEILAEIGLA
jgi:crotonobetainyl-CoA:carnitine CoA-transferase CaiB-like acyl-CoA transferase